MSKKVYVKGHWRNGRKKTGCSGCLGLILIVFVFLSSLIVSTVYSKYDTENKDLSVVLKQTKKSKKNIEEKTNEVKIDSVSKKDNSDKDSFSDFCSGICFFPLLILGVVFVVIIISKIMKNNKAKNDKINERIMDEKYIETYKKNENEINLIKNEYVELLFKFKEKLNISVSNLSEENVLELKDEIRNFFDELLEKRSDLNKLDNSYNPIPFDSKEIKILVIKDIISDMINDISVDKYLDEFETEYLDKIGLLLEVDVFEYFELELSRLIFITNIKNGNIIPIKSDFNLKGDEELYWEGTIKMGNVIRNELIFENSVSNVYLTNENLIIQGIRTFSIKLDSIVSIENTSNLNRNLLEEYNDDSDYEDYDYEKYEGERNIVNIMGTYRITFKPQSQYKEIQFLAKTLWMEILEEHINYFTKENN